ncbi:hypothetical protein QYE76_040278 [Lolium multiflorum]|uniref:Myb/SANT-like domain-containing protein n=1 Tax=Lolium multiflorum TaxID=4521 RepID=A0AAD8TAW3_LOLMU|nr:hypothetical protein QYE76_040278 [Lolium multiflorum]
MEMAGAATRIGEKRKGGQEGFRHLPQRPMAYFYPLLHSPPKFRAPPPVGKQVRDARISGRQWWQRRRRLLLGGFIYFLVQHIFTSDDDCKESLIPTCLCSQVDSRYMYYADNFSQTLVCVGDSQIPSQVPDSQPLHDSKVAVTPLRPSMGMWLTWWLSFVLEKMCSLIKTGVRTDKGFKEVHLTAVAKGLFEHYDVSACSTQVYNHLRKWRQRWVTITILHDLSEAQWCEDTKCIILEGEHYCGHVADNTKDAEYLNVPIADYDEMHTIFSFGLPTGKYAMGSSEPLGSAAANPSPKDVETQESNTVNLDGTPEKAADAPDKATAGKRKRGAFADDELVAFTNMTVAVKDVTQAIRDNKHTDMYPDVYNAVMDMLGFAEDDLMAAMSHLVDHKAQGCSFVGMIEPHRVLWLRNYLAKYHCKV